MNLKNTLITLANNTTDTVSNHMPDILMGIGLLAGAATVYSAVKQTLKSEPIIDEAKEELDALREEHTVHVPVETEDGTDYQEVIDIPKGELTKVYIKTGAKLLQNYLPTLALATTSGACILAANGMLKTRTAQTVAAYNTLDTVFKRYRSNVIEKYGEEEDKRLRYGIKDKKVDVIEYDEEGNEVKGTKKVSTLPSDFLNVSEYARFFGRYTEDGTENLQWSRIPSNNALFLRNTQTWFNDKLNIKGHVFLNEVYDYLGFPRTKAGQVVGWVKGENNNPVNFGIDNIYHALANDDLTFEQGILLDFNVDGVIIDKI